MNSAAASRAAAEGERVAARAARSRAVQVLGSVGILARALLVFVVAAIAAGIVRGAPRRSADSRGALETLASSPGGLVLLVLLAVAFAGHAGWRLLEAATGLRRDTGERRALKRAWFAAVGLLYVWLCVTTVRIVIGRDAGSDDATSHRTASDVLGMPGGRVLTGAIGAVIVGIGVGVAVWALRGRFLRSLHIERLGPRMRRAVRWIGAAGQAARAFVVVLVGLLFVDAAVEDDGSRAQGLDGTLRTLAARPYGSALLTATCVGLVLFGLYSIVQGLLLRTSHDDAG